MGQQARSDSYVHIYDGYPEPGIRLVKVKGPRRAEFLSGNVPTQKVGPVQGWPEPYVRAWEGQWGDLTWVGDRSNGPEPDAVR